jgi:Flp pilus assembly protein TadG
MKQKIYAQRTSFRRDLLSCERGVTAIIVGILMFLFIAFTALAIDVGHMMVVQNELQNAADAGALAGALYLYDHEGTEISIDANQQAFDTSIANRSEQVPVDVHWSAGNAGDVERGHWSFNTRTFTANDSTDVTSLWNVSTEDLDANSDFINAVRVKARREDTPMASFFAHIFGYDSFIRSAEAVAYRGFAGTLTPEEADQPIAICRESLLDPGGKYSCSIGRMINSGQQVESSETGGWTSFAQGPDVCSGGTNAQEVKNLVCGDGNPEMVGLGELIATNGGQIQSAFSDLYDCWDAHTEHRHEWNLTLPVISCPGNNVGTCEEVVGAVNVDVIWITGAGEDPQYKEAPTEIHYGGGVWSYLPDAGNTNGLERWESFASYFNLKNVDGSSAPYDNKSIYFLPNCEPHIPAGRSGGENFGILARIPVLVN